MAFFTNILFGKNGGLTHDELHRMSFRNRFSDFLPYVAYDDETERYLNSDNTVGFMWECTPLVYASPAIHDGLFSDKHGTHGNGTNAHQECGQLRLRELR